MAVIRSFKAFRPRPDICDRVAALPYDVYNRKEACEEVRREPMSFLKVDRAETSFDDSVDTYAPEVYKKAGDLLHLYRRRKAGLLHICIDYGRTSSDRFSCLCIDR